MKVHWLNLLLAVVILLPPVPFPEDFRKALRRSNAVPGGVRKLWQNWVDLVRAAFGVWLLNDVAITVDANQPGADFNAIAVKAAVLGLVLLPQVVRLYRNVQMLAPVLYLCGVTISLGGYDSNFIGEVLGLAWFQHLPVPGVFAVGVGWLFALGGKNLAYQLPAMAVAAAIAAYVIGPLEPLMLACGLILIPLVLSTLFRKRLWFAAGAAAA
jgi:hypothetical protein